MKKIILGIGVLVCSVTACTTSSGLGPLSPAHITAPAKNEPPVASIPALARPIPQLAKPSATPKLETYSVVVSQLDVHDLLFALARDARINVDVSPGVTGVVTLNAINQTLPQILDRIARQVDLRWSMENGVLNITPDSPMVKIYHVDYFNLARNMKSTLNILNSVKSVAEDSGGSGANGSTSFSSIDSESQNQFWKRLEANLKEILDVKAEGAATTALNTAKIAQLSQQATQKIVPQSADASTALAVVDKAAKLDKTLAQTEKVQAETAALQMKPSIEPKPVDANFVVINPETGTITIRASSKGQAKVAEFLASIQASAQRQVLIEATIVEVVLSDQYQAGVDWSQIANGAGWSFGQSLIGANLSAAPLSLISYKSTDFNATVKLLEQFGKTRVLSSPKITALNNQPAVMKVVEELVYFTMNVTQSTSDSNGIITPPTYESVLRTVPVGLVMQVTPQISASGMISMSIRPTITNVSGYVEDPAVAIIAAQTNTTLKSLVPELQVREFDSTLKIASGQVAVLGGLIQDKQTNQRQGVPGLSRLPWLGDAFSYRDDKVRKIELVVFLRPIVVKESGQDERLGSLKSYLPSDDFFNLPQDQELSAFQSGLIPFPRQQGVRQ